MAVRKRWVLTVHGLNTTGPWQKPLKDLFEPHFEYKAVCYRHYRWLGFPQLLVEPWVLFPLGCLVLLFRNSLQPLWLWLVLVVMLSFLSSKIRIRFAARSVRKNVQSYMQFQQSPHIIAHSLGSYLVERAMEDPSVSFSHVVFAGCPLDRNLDWVELQRSDQTGFERVQNEVQEKDLVVTLAPNLHCMVDRRFGTAGLHGFQDLPGYVDSTDSPHASRAPCMPGSRVAPIHNVHVREFGHSDSLSPRYAAYFWLPFFWGIEPPEYSKFTTLCLTAAEMDDQHNRVRVRIAEEVLATYAWRWADGSLRDYIRTQIQSRDAVASDALIALAISGTWRIFNKATVAYHDRHRPRWNEEILGLNPSVAVTKAVDALPL